jgi:hypothetical protein
MTSDEFVAQFAAASVDQRIALLQALRPPLSRDALQVLADALADERWTFVGPPGWEEDRQSVAYAAKEALAKAGAPAESALVPKLDDPSESCRKHAADLLAKLPVLAPGTIDALLRHSADPALACNVGQALRGKLDARPLLDFPETRLAGLLASPDLEPAWLAELLGDPSLRIRVLGRIRETEPSPDELLPLVEPLLAAPDDGVARAAFCALTHLANESAALTATLIAAAPRHDRDSTAWLLLARRSQLHLRTHVPELVAALARTAYAAFPLGALGPTAPPQVAIALGHELASGRAYMPIVQALDQLGPAALPALPMLVAAAQDLDDDAQPAAGRLVAKLRGLRR